MTACIQTEKWKREWGKLNDNRYKRWKLENEKNKERNFVY